MIRRDALRTLVLFFFLGEVLSACSAKGRIVTLIEEDYCFPIEDDLGGDIQRGRLQRLRAHGEVGRQALVQVASKEGRDQACALAYLCTLADKSALPIALELLRPSAPVRIQETALSCLGLTKDSRFVDEIAPYVRSPVRSIWFVAVGSLAMIDDAEVRVILRDLLVHPVYEHSQHVVIRALAQQKDLEAIPLILDEGRRPGANDLVRYEIVAALSALDAIATYRDALDVVSRIETKATRVAALEAIWNSLQGQLSALPFGRDKDDERRMLEKAIEEVKQKHRAER